MCTLKQIEKILDDAKPYEDKLFFCPLKESEISELEKKLKKKIPNFFKVYLSRVGIIQDLIEEVLFESFADYVLENEFLDEHCKESDSFFPIGQNGYGDLLLLHTASSEENGLIYKFSHETRKLKNMKESFADLVENAVIKAKKGYKKRKLNCDKRWSVQFSFDTLDEDGLFQVLENIGFTTISEKGWVFTGTTPAGVSSYTREIIFNNEIMNIDKDMHDGWATPIYSVDFEENALKIHYGSKIQKIRASLSKQEGLKWEMVNWGIL